MPPHASGRNTQKHYTRHNAEHKQHPICSAVAECGEGAGGEGNLFRVFVTGLYILISGGANVAYIALRSRSNNSELIMLQLFAAIYYNVARLLTPAIRNHLFPTSAETGGLQMNASIWTSSLILAIIDFLVPYIATLFSDYTCFYEVVAGTQMVTSDLSSRACLLYYNQTTECAVVQESTDSLNFQPSFVYSNQCRYTIYGVLCTAQLILLYYISKLTGMRCY